MASSCAPEHASAAGFQKEMRPAGSIITMASLAELVTPRKRASFSWSEASASLRSLMSSNRVANWPGFGLKALIKKYLPTSGE